MANRTLVSWIGATDLASMGREVGGAIKEQVEQAIRRPVRDSDNEGPIKTLLSLEKFDSIHLLNNYHESLQEPFVDWLGVNAATHYVDELESPTDYAAIYVIVDKFLTLLFEAETTRPTELCIFLTPGSPAMAASWVLIGKSKYSPTFFQSYAGQCSVTEIPFDLKLHIKEIVGNSDSTYEYLRGANPEEFEAFSDLVGESEAMRRVIGKAQKVAIRDVPVLLLGESGTGKTHIAMKIHQVSSRASKEFRSVNCAALPADLLESELFGHVQGAFTGADSDKAGLFEITNGGTLFLDEIGECPLPLQAKLLSVLQPITAKGPGIRKIRRVGGSAEIEVDVRVVAATNRDLIDLVDRKQFREDLFYRLAAITLQLPPLRDRKEDIAELAEKLLHEVNQSFTHEATSAMEPDFEPRRLSKDALEYLQSQSWPGNVRQVYNVLLQAVVMSNGAALTRDDLVACEFQVPGVNSLHILDHEVTEGFDLQRQILDVVRKHYIEKALRKAGSVKQAMKVLGYNTEQTLRNHIKELGIHF